MFSAQIISFLVLATSSIIFSNAQFHNKSQSLYQHIVALNGTCDARSEFASLILESPLFPPAESNREGSPSHPSDRACIDVKNTPEHHYPSKTGSRTFCAYVDPQFAGGRGIAMVTSSEIAQYVNAQTPAFVDPKLFKGISPYTTHTYPSFYEAEIPGRGKGLIANRTIHRGDLIFRYAPVLAMHIDALKSASVLNQVVKKLPPKTYELFMGQHAEFGGEKVHSITITNGYQAWFGAEDELHFIVLPEISRINHDCRPNAAYHFEETDMLHYVYASQTIHAGEELSVSYTKPTMSKAQRQETIKQFWGFNCTCSACSQSPVQTAKSDRRLAMTDTLKGKLNDWSPKSDATPATAEALISIYEQEKLYSYLAVPFRLASLAYNAACDKEGAMKYGLLALEQQKLESGGGGSKIEMIKSLLYSPEEHWSWCKRERVRG